MNKIIIVNQQTLDNPAFTYIDTTNSLSDYLPVTLFPDVFSTRLQTPFCFRPLDWIRVPSGNILIHQKDIRPLFN